jgi:hypothetical protein
MRKTPAYRHKALHQISPQLFKLIEENMSSVLDVFTTCTTENINPWDDQEFFRLSMRALGVSFPADCMRYMSSGDIIEGYNRDRLQIFRNLRFIECSNYSLLEILSTEWPLLFERSAAITNQMITYCDETLWSKNRTIAFNIPKHYVRELQTAEHQVYEIGFKTISPLFSGPDRPLGILANCNCLLLESKRYDNLAFI